MVAAREMVTAVVDMCDTSVIQPVLLRRRMAMDAT